MKLIASLAFCLCFIACQEAPKSSKDTNDSVKEPPVVATSNTCYQYATKSDTIRLDIIRDGQSATGDLFYALSGKDRNNGTFTGTINGDLLIADYKFQSEGQESVRQVAFKFSGNALKEGFGPVKQEGNRQVFENPDALTFNEEFLLKEGSCR